MLILGFDILHNCVNSPPFVVKAASRRADLPACGGEITEFRAWCAVTFPQKREPPLPVAADEDRITQSAAAPL